MQKIFKVLFIIVCLTMFASIVVSSTSTTIQAASEPKLKLNHKKITISLGDTFSLKATGVNGKPKWKSLNPNIASVDKNGEVTAISCGVTKIKCLIGKYTAKCNVIVNLPKVEEIKLSDIYLEMEVGNNTILNAQTLPENSFGDITWISSNESVAKVNNGIITAIGIGECKITAYLNSDDKICAECSINILEKQATLIGIRLTHADVAYAFFDKEIKDGDFDIKLYCNENEIVDITIDYDKNNFDPDIQKRINKENIYAIKISRNSSHFYNDFSNISEDEDKEMTIEFTNRKNNKTYTESMLL